MYNDTTSCYSRQTLEHQSLSDSVPVKKKFNNPHHKTTLPTEGGHGTTQLSHNSGVPSLTVSALFNYLMNNYLIYRSVVHHLILLLKLLEAK